MEVNTKIVATVRKSKATGRYFLRIDDLISADWQPIKIKAKSRGDILNIVGIYCNGIKFDQFIELSPDWLAFTNADKSEAFILHIKSLSAKIICKGDRC